MFSSIFVNAQVKYPYQQKNQDGTIEYVFNYEQANYINNQFDAQLFIDSLIAKYDIQDSMNVIIIDNANNLISKFKLIIDNDTKALSNRDSVIKVLQSDIDTYKKEVLNLKDVVRARDKTIKIQRRVLWVTIPVSIISVILNYILIKK